MDLYKYKYRCITIGHNKSTVLPKIPVQSLLRKPNILLALATIMTK